MKRYAPDATTLIFETLAERGITQEWLARQLGIHSVRLSEYKAGRKPMPDEIVERSFELLVIPSTVLSLFLLSVSREQDDLSRKTATAHAD